MSSRAALLLQREQHRIRKMPKIWGIDVKIVQNDIFRWEGVIDGLPDTPWEGGLFKVDLFFDEDYNEKPPEIRFTTIPFHPNVDMQTGRPCISFLEDTLDWNPDMPILEMLAFVQFLLANPSLDDPVNAAAADIYTNSPRLYDQLVRDCVVASRRVNLGLSPFHEEEYMNGVEAGEEQDPDRMTVPQTEAGENFDQPPVPKVQTISFDDYYEHWKGVATSVPGNNQHARVSRPRELLISDNADVTDGQYREMMERQRNLWFGKFPPRKEKPKPRSDTASRDEHVRAMRQLYSLQTPNGWKQDHDPSEGPPGGAMWDDYHTTKTPIGPQVIPSTTPRLPPKKTGLGGGDGPGWEKEADELLEWTAQLAHEPV
ncbi:ubiquitin-conjugating enzyme/RWD-like protein [Phlyctochytrium arcticum]|nr:ubiquitin-conjugating enzyme/RWD-like protein [Phlyctochytrium arcticum]